MDQPNEWEAIIDRLKAALAQELELMEGLQNADVVTEADAKRLYDARQTRMHIAAEAVYLAPPMPDFKEDQPSDFLVAQLAAKEYDLLGFLRGVMGEPAPRRIPPTSTN